MMVFWILVAGLVGLALLFVLTPLLRKSDSTRDVDPAELNRSLFHQQLAELEADLAAGNLEPARYQAARHDLERQLLDNLSDAVPTAPQPLRSGRWAALVLAIAVPAAAIGLYRMLGNAEIIPRLETLSHASTPTDPAKGDLPPMEVLVERLAEKLAQNPDNLEGWLMLGRSYNATGQTEKALAAYGRAYQLAPHEPEVMLTYAEALAVSNDNQLSGEPERLVAAALETAPNNPNALWLSGVAALQRGEREAAVRHWEALYALLPADGEDAENLRGFIAQARGEPVLGQSPASSVPPASTPSAANTVPATASVRVEVSLAEPLRARVKPEDAVFVYAKAFQGPPMPLAVHRAQVRDLPLAVTLDDSLAMTPQLKLSNFPQVSIGARVSPSGSAIAQPGDLEGERSPVAPGQAEPIRVTIDSVRP